MLPGSVSKDLLLSWKSRKAIFFYLKMKGWCYLEAFGPAFRYKLRRKSGGFHCNRV